MKRIHRLALVVLILVACTSCDQMTKSIAKESMASSMPVSLLNDSIRVEYSENPGAFLGLGANLPGEARFLFLVVVVCMLLATTLFVAVNTRSFNWMQVVGLSLMTAGGMGNLLDRLFNNGAAIDFVRLRIGPFQTGIFNLADVAIMVGGVAFVLFSTKGKTRAALHP